MMFWLDAIDRLPQTGNRGLSVKLELNNLLIAHRQYINLHGEDLPQVRGWKWSDSGQRHPLT